MFVGGQIGEWLAGLFAAIGILAAGRRSDAGGELVDVSMLEALAMCLTYYPVTFNDQLGRPMRRRRFVPTPGVGAARDGLVGLGCGTGQQWLDFCAMVEHPEWMEDPKLFLDRTALAPTIDAWIADHTVEEVLDLASAFRIPNAPIANGSNIAHVRAFPRPWHLRRRTRGTGRRTHDRRSGWGRRASGRRSRPLGSASTRSTAVAARPAPPIAPPRPRRRPGPRSAGCACST